jgi:hypothetical protein
MQEALTARSRRTRAALVAAVRSVLRESGTFDAERVAAVAGCSPATYYAHLSTNDDALSEAFALVLEDLDLLSEDVFTIAALRGMGVDGFCRHLVERFSEFFTTESAVFRAALAKLYTHQRMRSAYREADAASHARVRRLLENAAAEGIVAGGSAPDRAEAIVVLLQGLNNPHVVRRPAPGGTLSELARSLACIVRG